MSTTKTPEVNRDLTSSPKGWLIWGVPGLAIIASGIFQVAIPIIWPLSQVWMGGACLLNARRCRRTHCYFTGPFFLIMATASIAYGLGALPLGQHGWDWIGWLTIGGGLALSCIPEHIWGRYRRGECDSP